MHILTIGLNHKSAPVSVRERFAFSPSSLPRALKTLRNTKSILECAILSTCNRMEIYVVCDQLHTGRYYVKTFLAQWFNIDTEEFVDHLYMLDGNEAVEHLFEVACGLDSMVLGETQILGQVREAMQTAHEAGSTGTLLNRLFRQAVTVGKKAQSETEIGQNAVSVSYAAVELGKKIFDDFTGKTMLILGAGKMGELTAKHLQSNGADRVLVVNRSKERGEALAERFSGEAYSFHHLEQAVEKSDVIISSTGSEEAVLTKEQVARVMKKRRNRPLFLIDIAVPRDIEASVHDIENVFLYDIDDLEGIVAFNKEERAKEAEKVRELILAEMDEFTSWLQTLGVVPLISALREKALNAQAEAMQRIERKIPDLTERERKILSKQTKSIVNQLLRDPIIQIKELAAEPGGEEALKLFERLFALEVEEEGEEEAGQETYSPTVERVPVRT